MNGCAAKETLDKKIRDREEARRAEEGRRGDIRLPAGSSATTAAVTGAASGGTATGARNGNISRTCTLEVSNFKTLCLELLIIV